jgi:hypothetical protein
VGKQCLTRFSGQALSDAGAQSHPRSVPHSQPDACSVLWDQAQTLATGTAPSARFWLALEQNGPWGARAATQSHLDPDLGGDLDRVCQEASGRLILIRRPGRHPDWQDTSGRIDPQRLYIAGGLADHPWLLQADLDGPRRVERLRRLAEGLAPLGMGSKAGDLGLETVRDLIPELQPSPGPVLMICTNSRRDVCCSVRGRPVAAEAAARRPGQVWECSHTGGHRFAPTGVLLPFGQTLGRLSGSSAVAAIDAGMRAELADQLLAARHDRGRSHLGPPEQAAESLVREQIREHRLLALSTKAAPRGDEGNSYENASIAKTTAVTGFDVNDNTENTWRCRVSHTDGRHWDVVVVRRPGSTPLPESCGKEPVPSWQWSILSESGRPTPGKSGQPNTRG